MSVQADRLAEHLLDVAVSIFSAGTLDGVLRAALAASRELTGAQYAAIGILDPTRTQLHTFVTDGLDEHAVRTIGDLPKGRGVLGLLIEDPRPIRLDDIGSHPKSYGFPLGHPAMKTFLGVPILRRGVAWGNFYLTEKENGETFTAADEAMLIRLSGWVAIAATFAQDADELRARTTQLENTVAGLEANTDVARVLAGETDLGRVLELVAKRGRAAVNARTLVVLLPQDGHLVLRAAAGETDRLDVGYSVPFSQAPISQVVMAQRRPRLVGGEELSGSTLAQRAGARSALYIPLVLRQRTIGILVALDRLEDGPGFTNDDAQLLSGFATSAAIAIATAATFSEEGLRRSIEATERERGYWARELHDQTLQELAAIKLVLGMGLKSESPAAVVEAVQQAIDQVELAASDLRGLVTDLRPAALPELGLVPAIRTLGERAGRVTGIRLDLACDPDVGERIRHRGLDVEIAVYRIVQEALSNATKHSNARNVAVALAEENGWLVASVTDDGVGFDKNLRSEGFGLIGMRERAALIGADLSIVSRLGRGTRVELRVPIVPEVH